MAMIQRKRAHKRTLDEAKKGLAQAMGMIAEKVPGANEPQIAPDGRKGELTGPSFQAVLTVDEHMLHIDVSISFPASLFKGKIESEMDKLLDQHFPH